MVSFFHCKDRDSYEEALHENDVIPKEDKMRVRKLLTETRHVMPIIKTDQPAGYSVLTNT